MNTTTTNGVFNVLLGSGTPLPVSAMNAPLWLGVQPDGQNEMHPLSPLAASPYALAIPNGSITTAKIADSAITPTKMGMPFVSGIYVNGQLATPNNGALNIMGAEGALQFDQTTNTLTLGATTGITGGNDGKGGATTQDLGMAVNQGDNLTAVNFVPKWLAANNAPSGLNSTIVNSSIFDNGTAVSIGYGGAGSCASDVLDVNGDINVNNTQGYRINCLPVLFISPGTDNTFVGIQSAIAATGNNNTGVGYNAMVATTSGTNNTAMGYDALATNQTQYDNTAIGYQALYNDNGSADEGTNNTAVGMWALVNNTTGKGNTAVGSSALNGGTPSNTGDFNAAFGLNALYHNTLGSRNDAFGNGAEFTNSKGSYNTAMGDRALEYNTNGNANTAIGYQALWGNSLYNNNNNTAVGYNALAACITDGLTAVGYQALAVNTTGEYNTATGDSALAGNTTGNDNDAYGYYALTANTTGITNDAFGTLALAAVTTGESNAGFGYEVLSATTTPNNNSGLGYKAGIANTTGADNTFIGYNTGADQVTGSNNTFLGFQADIAVGMDPLANATAIGNGAAVENSNAIQLGNNSICYYGSVGHIRSENTVALTPTAGAGSGAGGGAIANFVGTATDVAGTITVQCGLTPAATGAYATVTFGNCAYNNPVVVITPTDCNTSTQFWSVTTSSGTSFTIHLCAPHFGPTCGCSWPAPTANESFTWNYHVIDTK